MLILYHNLQYEDDAARDLVPFLSRLVTYVFALSPYRTPISAAFRVTGRGMLVDQAVVEQARAGDASAFNQIVLSYRRRVLGIVSRLIGRPEDVEDVAQEVFVRLYHSLDQLRSPEVFEPWLYRLSTNACYDYLRKSKRRPELRMSDLSEQQVTIADATAGSKASAEAAQQSRVRELMQSLLGAVSEQDRLLLTLKEVEGLSLKELERVYQVNENVLKVRLFRARQRVLKAYRRANERGTL